MDAKRVKSMPRSWYFPTTSLRIHFISDKRESILQKFFKKKGIYVHILHFDENILFLGKIWKRKYMLKWKDLSPTHLRKWCIKNTFSTLTKKKWALLFPWYVTSSREKKNWIHQRIFTFEISSVKLSLTECPYGTEKVIPTHPIHPAQWSSTTRKYSHIISEILPDNSKYSN